MKKCNKCKIEKEFIEFPKNKTKKDGYQSQCKICVNNYKLIYRKLNKEKIKNWYNSNKNYFKDYYKLNKQKIDNYRLEYEKKRKNERRIYFNNWQKINQKKRRLNEPLYKLTGNIRNSITQSFRKNGYTKKSRTYQILGCTFEEFKLHIEKQFTKGMNWENQGQWHFDHIYPISLAKDEEELIRLNHYTNFQPLWAIDNLKKGNKIIDNKQLKLI